MKKCTPQEELPKISLRGTIAQIYFGLEKSESKIDIVRSILTALQSDESDLAARFEDKFLVIGLSSEQGRYPPDW